MAVTITRAALAVELRLIAAESDTIAPGIASVLDRALAAASAAVLEYAPTAPDALHNEAVVRLASVLYDQAGSQSRGGNPFVTSGAAALLSRHRTRSAISPAGTAAAGGTPAPGDGVDTAAVNALIAAALASYSPVDQTARAGVLALQENIDTVAMAAAGKVTAPITDGDIPAGIARDAEVTAAVGAVRQVPATAAQDVGRVLGVGSNRAPFWDLPLAVLLRALAPGAQDGGKYVRLGSDRASIDLVDGTAATGGEDATARASAASAQADAARNTAGLVDVRRELSRVTFDHVLRDLVSGDDVRLRVVTPAQWTAGNIPFADFQLQGSYAADGDGYWLAAVGPGFDIRSLEMGQDATHQAHGSQFHIAATAKVTGLPNGWKAWAYNWHASATEPSAIFGSATAMVPGHVHADIPRWVGELGDGIVTLDALAAAVAARLLPALPAEGSRNGKVPVFGGDTLQWATPGGGGISAPTVLATETLSGNHTTFETTWRLPATARAIQIESEGAAPQFRSPLLWTARIRALPAASSGSGQLTKANSFAVEAYDGGYVRIGRDTVYRLLIQRSGQTSAGSWNTTLTILGW